MDEVTNIHPSRQNLIHPPGRDAREPQPKGKGKKKNKKSNKNNQPNKPPPQGPLATGSTSPQGASVPAPPAAQVQPTQPDSHLSPKTGFSYIDTAGQICHITSSDYNSVSQNLTTDYKPILQSIAILETILSNPRILHFCTHHPALDRDMVRCQQFMGMIKSAITRITLQALAQSTAVLDAWEKLLDQLESKFAAEGMGMMSGQERGPVLTACNEAKGVVLQVRLMIDMIKT